MHPSVQELALAPPNGRQPMKNVMDNIQHQTKSVELTSEFTSNAPNQPSLVNPSSTWINHQPIRAQFLKQNMHGWTRNTLVCKNSFSGPWMPSSNTHESSRFYSQLLRDPNEAWESKNELEHTWLQGRNREVVVYVCVKPLQTLVPVASFPHHFCHMIIETRYSLQSTFQKRLHQRKALVGLFNELWHGELAILCGELIAIFMD